MNVIPFREMGKIFLFKKILTEFSVKMVIFRKMEKSKRMEEEDEGIADNLTILSSSKVLELTIFDKIK